MRFLLPEIQQKKFKKNIYWYDSSIISHKNFENKDKKWRMIISIFISLFFLIVTSFVATTFEKKYPFVSPVPSVLAYTKSKKTSDLPVQFSSVQQKSFAFIPGWRLSNIVNSEIKNIDNFAFYDLVIDSSGHILRDNTGYENVHSQEFSQLTAMIHSQNKKIYIAVSNESDETIINLLNNENNQQNFIHELTSEIRDTAVDGAVLVFELKQKNTTTELSKKFTVFIQNVKQSIAQQPYRTELAIAISSQQANNRLFDITSLKAISDGLFIQADSYAVPESAGAAFAVPVWVGEKTDYIDRILSATTYIPYGDDVRGMIFEKAWYGDGNRYPFRTNLRTDTFSVSSDYTAKFEEKTIQQIVEMTPVKARMAAQKNIPLIIEALQKENILSPNVLAYALATIEHETAGTFDVIEEIKGSKSARRFGYEGGTAFYGRGFIQLTHLRNYHMFSKRIGLSNELVNNPDLASKPEIAAHILAAFFKDNGVARLADNGKFELARSPVNPDRYSQMIARNARRYRFILG